MKPADPLADLLWTLAFFGVVGLAIGAAIGLRL